MPFYSLWRETGNRQSWPFCLLPKLWGVPRPFGHIAVFMTNSLKPEFLKNWIHNCGLFSMSRCFYVCWRLHLGTLEFISSVEMLLACFAVVGRWLLWIPSDLLFSIACEVLSMRTLENMVSNFDFIRVSDRFLICI